MLLMAFFLVFILAGLSGAQVTEPAAARGRRAVLGPQSPPGVLAGGFKDLRGIAVTARGEVVVADTGRGEIVVLDHKGRVLRRLGRGLLRGPMGVAVAQDGTLLVSDSLTDQIHQFSLSGEHLRKFGGIGEREGLFSGAGPLDIGVDGQLYVIDIDHNRVQAFDERGRFRFAFGKTGRFAHSAPGEFYFPGGLASDAAGRIYVSDTHDFRVQVFSAAGAFLATWGRQGTGPGEFDHPFGLAVDSALERVYVVDDQVKLQGGGNRIQVFSLAGRFLSTLPAEPPLQHPFDVAVNRRGQVFVTERGAGRIRVIDGNTLPAGPAFGPSSRPATRPSSSPTSRKTSGGKSPGEGPRHP